MKREFRFQFGDKRDKFKLSVRCTFGWMNSNPETILDHPVHTCKIHTGHITAHRCNCGTSKINRRVK